MLDYGALAPEINSVRMYSGPGSGPMVAAATAWDTLANELETVSRGYSSIITQLQGGSWSGGASVAMASAAAPYVAWMATAGVQAEEAASQARAAAIAYETAFAATVPPGLVAANRTLLAQLIATNILGQNTAMIGTTEASYQEMWAQDAAAMYGYAASSSGATRLTQFNQPPQTTTSSGPSAQAAAVAQATGTSAAGKSQTTLSQFMSAVPKQLQSLATTGSSGSSSSSALTGFSDFNTVTSPINLGDGISRTITSGGSFGTGLFRSNLQDAAASAADASKAADAARAAEGAANAARGATASAVTRGPVLAGLGSGTSVGALSVPQSWAATNPAVTTIAETHWLSDAELEGGPSWHEAGPAAGVWNGAPAAGAGAASGLVSRPMVNNVLRVTPRQFKMPRPSSGG
ncbi:PPE family protein [Mycobacterium intracellulare]|uniref:PPE family protein n=1 Tax=Mycobacterium intracellulare TaxID=1767 RepID=UPI003353CA02